MGRRQLGCLGADLLERASFGLAALSDAGDRVGADAEDADGFQGGLAKRDRVIAARESRTGSVEVEVGLLPGLGQLGRRRFAVGA